MNPQEQKTNQNQPKPKTLYMTKEERQVLQARDGLANSYEYQIQLIRQDMNSFVETVIAKRLGVGEDKRLSYDVATGVIQVIDVPPTTVTKEENKNEPVTTK